jgi:hypothetical protein
MIAEQGSESHGIRTRETMQMIWRVECLKVSVVFHAASNAIFLLQKICALAKNLLTL